jgi:hypothetical protein
MDRGYGLNPSAIIRTSGESFATISSTIAVGLSGSAGRSVPLPLTHRISNSTFTAGWMPPSLFRSHASAASLPYPLSRALYARRRRLCSRSSKEKKPVVGQLSSRLRARTSSRRRSPGSMGAAGTGRSAWGLTAPSGQGASGAAAPGAPGVISSTMVVRSGLATGAGLEPAPPACAGALTVKLPCIPSSPALGSGNLDMSDAVGHFEAPSMSDAVGHTAPPFPAFRMSCAVGRGVLRGRTGCPTR